MKKIFKGLCVLLLSLGVLACGKKEAPEQVNQEITYRNVKTIEANKKEINKISISSGTLDSMNEVEQVLNSRGDIIKINYKNGDKVKKGDIILVLENQDIKSAYLEGKAKLISAEADYKTQSTTYKKYEKLYKEKLISENEYLEIKNKLASSKGIYEAAKASLSKEEKNYKDLTVKAKISGTIGNLDFKLYGKVEPQTPLFKIVDNENLRILSGISAKDIVGLKIGSKADVYVESSKESTEGTLYEINPIASEGTRKYEVKIKIDNKDGKFMQGMFARVALTTGKKEGIMVPKSAIIVEELYSYIYKVTPKTIEIEKNGEKEKLDVMIAKKVRVELGETEGEAQEVISNELADENKVVTVGQYSLADGDYTKEMK